MPTRDEVVHSLRAWTVDGPQVCLLEGFSGVGKTWVAHELARTSPVPVIYESVPAEGYELEDLLFVLAAAAEGAGLPVQESNGDLNVRTAIIVALREPCLVILDDVQNLLDPVSRVPSADFLSFVHSVTEHPASRGRLMMVTNHAMPEGAWRDQILIRKLPAFDDGDGIGLLRRLLSQADITDSVPPEKEGDVVRWLGGNPRALHIMVACLSNDSLEDLISLEPLSWEIREQVASPQLVAKLEARFMDRALSRLDSSARQLLDNLAAYRRPFVRDAIDRANALAGGLDEARRTLIDGFVLNLNRNWYSLNPIARQLALSRLRRDDRKERLAYEAAADHYIRHFRAKGVSDRTAHPAEFVEARYHLMRSGREEEFAEIGALFRQRLLNVYYGPDHAVPQDPEKVQELVMVLATALDGVSGRYEHLRYYLARLLLARGRPGDDRAAINQTRQAIVGARNDAVWVLHLRLLAQIEGLAAVRAAAQIAYGTSLNNHGKLVVSAAEAKLLARAGQYDKALEAVEAALVRPGAQKNHLLYQLASGYQLHLGRYQDAMETVFRGMRAVEPSDKMFHRVLEAGLFPALGRNDLKTIRALRDEISPSGNGLGHRALCSILELECVDDFEAAARYTIPTEGLDYQALRGHKAFSQLVSGDSESAERTFFGGRRVQVNKASEWLAGLIFLARGKSQAAEAAFQQCIGRPLTEIERRDPNFWVRIWDDVPGVVEPFPAFYFPRLPAVLTGILVDLVRMESGPSALYPGMFEQVRLRLTTDVSDFESAGGTALPDSSLSRERSHSAPPITIVNQVSPSFGAVTQGDSMGDTYNVGQAGAVGAGATATGLTFNQIWTSQTAGAGRDELRRELELILSELRSTQEPSQSDRPSAEIASAIATLESGDSDATVGHLKAAGRWALGTATAIGASVAAAAIKAAIGM